MTTQSEGQVGQRVTLLTLDRVLASETLSGTDLLVPTYIISGCETLLGYQTALTGARKEWKGGQ